MFEWSCLQQRRLFMFVRHYASRQVSCGMLTKVCKAHINYLKRSCFLHYLLMVWSHIFPGCSQGGKVTVSNTLCTFKATFIDEYNMSHMITRSTGDRDGYMVTCYQQALARRTGFLLTCMVMLNTGTHQCIGYVCVKCVCHCVCVYVLVLLTYSIQSR